MSIKSIIPAFIVASSAGPALVYVGDWGGDDDDAPTTAAQVTTAAGMARVAQDLNADSVLLLGDNFYNYGVDSLDSSRFESTFENVYKPGLFGDCPFHVIAGNHDHYGNPQAQIDYSAKSKHWNFPSFYYNLNWQWKADNGEQRTAQLVMIDTWDLAGDAAYADGASRSKGALNESSANEQLKWIEQQLTDSTADYLWVAGHYPIYSAGDDGTVKTLVKKLLPLLKKHGAHYICGHDHLVQHLYMDGVHQFQQGMGMTCCYGVSNMDTVPDGYIQFLRSGHGGQGTHIGGDKLPKMKGGFNSMEFGDEAVTVTSHKEDGEAIYSVEVPRRSAAPAPPSPSSSGFCCWYPEYLDLADCGSCGEKHPEIKQEDCQNENTWCEAEVTFSVV